MAGVKPKTDLQSSTSVAERVQRGWAWLRGVARSTAGRLFAFFACLYVLTYQGRTNSYDGQSMYLTTQALLDRGSLALANPAFGVVGRGGLSYSYYGIGMSLVELPLYLVGKVLGLFAGDRAAQVAEAVTMLINPLLTTGILIVAYLTLRVLAYPRATAVHAVIVLGIATSLWPYSKTDLSEPLLTLCVAAAVLFALLAGRATRSTDVGQAARYEMLLGAALGGAMLTKYIAVAFVPLFCLYLTLALPRPFPLLRWLRQQARVLVPVLAAGVIVLLVNDIRFASPLQTGYPPGGRLFTIPVTDGIQGMLFSARRGLLFYDPLLMAGLMALPLLVWRRWREALLPLGLLFISLVLYGGFIDWGGGDSWGPRYLLPIAPFLLWPVLALGLFGSTGERGRLLPARWPPLGGPRVRAVLWSSGQAALGLLVALSVAIQLLGVTVNPLLFAVYKFDASSQSAATALATAPLVVAVWLLPLAVQFAFTRSLPASGFSAHDYPFGPPFPVNQGLPDAVGQYYPQWFWWTLTPRPLLAFAIGGLILGAGLVLSGRHVWRSLREGTKQRTSTSEPLC